MTKRYEFLAHTADAKFRAYGATMEEAFSNAALALFSVMTDPEKIKPKKEFKISVEGKNNEALLYNFLEELLFLLDTESFMLNSVKEIKVEHNHLRIVATVCGDETQKYYDIHGEVKAVTYNEMFVKQEATGWVVQVVVDL